MKSILLLASTLLSHSQAQSCSCSPTQYTFQLNLSSDCDSSTINENKPGIEGSLCFFGEGSTSGSAMFPGDMVLGGQGGTGPIRNLNLDTISSRIQHSHGRRLQDLDSSESTPPSSPITEVTSILFLEVDTTPELNIINQDSTYFSTSLPDGSVVTFTSVSDQLDYTVPLEDQMEYVPGGVVVVLFGNDEDGNVVQNTVAWDYGDECDSEPLEVGDTIGWIAIDDYAPAKAAFCPVVEAPPPTPAPTLAAIETEAPSPPPTEAAIETEAPTPAPVDPTEPPTVAVIETEAPTPSPIDPTEPPTVAAIITEPPTAAAIETEPPTATVIETASPTIILVVESEPPTAAGIVSSQSPTLYAGKGAKLFKGKSMKSAKAFSMDDMAKSGKVMSFDPHAKSGKSYSYSGDSKAGVRRNGALV